MRHIVLDTETTGLSASAGDRIIEIGCVEMLNRRLTGHNFHQYLNPERESHEDALKVHGLTAEFLQDKPKFEQIAPLFLDYIRGADLVIHNAPFDVGFIDAELERLGLPALATHVASITDSLALAKQLFPGKRNSLDALCDRMGVNNSARTLHGALLDAELLADVFLALTRGQEALIDDALMSEQAAGQRADLSGMRFVQIRPSELELKAHHQVLADMDKANGGKTLWMRLPAQEAGDSTPSAVA